MSYERTIDIQSRKPKVMKEMDDIQSPFQKRVHVNISCESPTYLFFQGRTKARIKVGTGELNKEFLELVTKKFDAVKIPYQIVFEDH